jgi:hypothetical protein
MMSLKSFFRNTAALCAILTAGVMPAEDGVVRMSDRNTATDASETDIEQVGFFRREKGCADSACGESCYVPQPCPGQWTQSCNQCDPCMTWNQGGYGSCYTPTDCNSCYSGCDAYGGGWGNGCQTCNDPHGGRRGRGGRRGHGDCDCPDCNQRGSRKFAKKCKDANNRVCDRLFGWMIPSGCYGQGAPWLGKYHMTYADQPSYIDPRDTQLYAAQGYGMPITVPLAPNVNHTYNYSSGIPASRVTTIGNYNPMSSPRPLNCQTW